MQVGRRRAPLPHLLLSSARRLPTCTRPAPSVSTFPTAAQSLLKYSNAFLIASRSGSHAAANAPRSSVLVTGGLLRFLIFAMISCSGAAASEFPSSTTALSLHTANVSHSSTPVTVYIHVGKCGSSTIRAVLHRLQARAQSTTICLICKAPAPRGALDLACAAHGTARPLMAAG